MSGVVDHSREIWADALEARVMAHKSLGASRVTEDPHLARQLDACAETLFMQARELAEKAALAWFAALPCWKE